MPHIAPSSWLMVMTLSIISLVIIMAKLSWSYNPSFYSFPKPSSPKSTFPWN